MRQENIIIFTVFIFCVAVCPAVYPGDNNFIKEYPDGSFGMDMGGGYEIAPVGDNGEEEILPPEGYRDTYVNTKYGPMTREGFSFYPEFRFSDTKSKEDSEKKQIDEEKEKKDYIFQVTGESTTTPGTAGISPIWGVYIPPQSQDGFKE
jgi:hypothetical protein